jgi:NAD/NADP transhydrogenase beta subunit
MFYMPGTKMLFGDAKETCDGKIEMSLRTDD